MKARIPGGSSSGGMMKKIQEMQENMTRIQQESKRPNSPHQSAAAQWRLPSTALIR